MAVDGADGTADIGEVRDVTGIESLDSLNYQIKNILVPAGLVETMNPRSEDGRSVGKVLSVTEKGREVASRIRDRPDPGDAESYLSIGERMDRLETRQNAELGVWSRERKQEYEAQLQMTRLMRNFLLDKYPEEFREYVEENRNSDDQTEN